MATKYLYELEGNVKFQIQSLPSIPPEEYLSSKDKIEELLYLVLNGYLFGGTILEDKGEYLRVELTRLDYKGEVEVEDKEEDREEFDSFGETQLTLFDEGSTDDL